MHLPSQPYGQYYQFNVDEMLVKTRDGTTFPTALSFGDVTSAKNYYRLKNMAGPQPGRRHRLTQTLTSVAMRRCQLLYNPASTMTSMPTPTASPE